MVIDKVLGSLAENCRFDFTKLLVVGVSGGADSLTLIHCLHKAGIRVVAGHFDHSLRPNSGDDALHVQQLMKDWGIPCTVEKADVRSIANSLKIGIEEAARICRYQFLFKLVREHQAQALAVAHNADDQVETILMHFLRGSGLNGLRGMQPIIFLKEIDPSIAVIRPMLDIYREDVLQYCQQENLLFLTDESNFSRAYFRNRLRHDVIPFLEQYSPAFKKVITRNAKAFQMDYSLLRNLEADNFETCVRVKKKNFISLDYPRFLKLEEGLQRRLLVKCVNYLSPTTRDIGYEKVGRVINAIKDHRDHIDLLSKIEVSLNLDSLDIYQSGYSPDLSHYPQLINAATISLDLNETVQLTNGWSLKAELVDTDAYRMLSKLEKQNPLDAWLNPVDLELPLTIRSMNPGERWTPLGMEGKHQKLSDFFINKKIPKRARPAWPLVLSESSILWVAGLRISQAWRLIGDETEILHLSLIDPKPGNN